MYHKQKNCLNTNATYCSRFFLGTDFDKSVFNSICSLNRSPQDLWPSFYRVLSDRFLSYSKERKFSRSDHSLSFVVTRCSTRCHSLYHSLTLNVIRFITRCHSLSLVVSLFVICCYSLWLVIPLVVTWCITRLSFYKRS